MSVYKQPERKAFTHSSNVNEYVLGAQGIMESKKVTQLLPSGAFGLVRRPTLIDSL